MKLETYLPGVEKASWSIGIYAGEFVADENYHADGKLLKRRRRQCTAFKAKVLALAGNGITSRRKAASAASRVLNKW